MSEHRSAPVSSEIVVVGGESVGKSCLVAGLTGKWPVSLNYGGTTVSVQSYSDGVRRWIDTPGVSNEIDAQTTKLALDAMAAQQTMVAVIQATSLQEDLSWLLPLVAGKRGAIVVTFWDFYQGQAEAEACLGRLEASLGVPVIPVDARRLTPADRQRIVNAVESPGIFAESVQLERAYLPRPTQRWGMFDVPGIAPLAALTLLLAPTALGVWSANNFAKWLDPVFREQIAGLLDRVSAWPGPWSHIFAREYGLLAMLPFLLLWALPTVLVFSVILALFKASGLIDGISFALHPLLRPFGIGGRDLVRIVMGFGCNVPAVINSRACSVCSRDACVSAICFGSACSYQLPATLAVFAAAGMPYLVVPYLLAIVVTTLVYLRVTFGRQTRRVTAQAVMRRNPLQFPAPWAVLREIGTAIGEFFRMAMPIFILVCALAGLAQWLGLIEWLVRGLAPVMKLLHLPGEAGLAVVLGSVRKDGIAIGLLNANWTQLKIPIDTPWQVLTITYLASVFTPCMVTLMTVGREMSWRFAAQLATRQVLFATSSSLLIAWIGRLLST